MNKEMKLLAKKLTALFLSIALAIGFTPGKVQAEAVNDYSLVNPDYEKTYYGEFSNSMYVATGSYIEVDYSENFYVALGDSLTLQPTVRDEDGNLMNVDSEDFYIEWYRRLPDEYDFEYLGVGSSYTIESVVEEDCCTDDNYVYYKCEIWYQDNQREEETFYIYAVDNPIDNVEVVSKDISIKEYTHGYFSYFDNEFEYSINDILEENPIQLNVTYRDNTKEIVEISSAENNDIDNLLVSWKYEDEVELYDLIEINIMGHELEVPVEIVENPDFDPVVSGKVIEMPENKSIYPIGTGYDCRGIKVELTYESGETEIITFDEAIPSNFIMEYSLKDYDVEYCLVSYMEEGQNNIKIEMSGLTIPVTTVEATKKIVSYKLVTMPKNIYGEGATIEITYSDESTQEVVAEEFFGSHGQAGVWENGYMFTNAGFYFNWAYSLDDFDNAKLAYGDNKYDIGEGEYSVPEFEGMDQKTLVAIALEYFIENGEFKGIQTDANTDSILMSALIYYDYGNWMGSGIELSIAEEYVKKMYDINELDLTKSSYYDFSKNVLVSDIYYKSSLNILFSDSLELYLENANSVVYKYTEENKDIYIELQKADNKIVFIGSSYEDFGNEENPTTNVEESTTIQLGTTHQGENNKEETTTTKANVKVKSTKIKSATKKKSAKKVKISLKKVKGVTGYQVKISTTKKFSKKKTITKNFKKNVFTIKKLKANKKYFVKARCYKVVKGKKYYGAWTKVKKVKIKK